MVLRLKMQSEMMGHDAHPIGQIKAVRAKPGRKSYGCHAKL
jgi:hypothetical protein